MNLWGLLDALMCGMWIAIYTLVLISSIKYAYPAISPLFPAFVLPWEITAVLYDIKVNVAFSYAVIAHVGFALLNLLILLVVLFRLRWYSLPQSLLYFAFLVASVFVQYRFVFQQENGQLFSSFFVTWVGVLAWLLFIQKREFPLNVLNIVIAALKATADTIGCALYFNKAGVIVKTCCVLLILTHMLHFVAIMRKSKRDRIL